MSQTLGLLALGSPVELETDEPTPFKGKVTGVAVYPASGGVRVLYMIGRWNNGEYTEKWFDSFLVHPADDTERMSVTLGGVVA